MYCIISSLRACTTHYEEVRRACKESSQNDASQCQSKEYFNWFLCSQVNSSVCFGRGKEATLRTVQEAKFEGTRRDDRELWVLGERCRLRKLSERTLLCLLSIYSGPYGPYYGSYYGVPILKVVQRRVSSSVHFCQRLPSERLILFPTFRPLSKEILSLFINLFLASRFFHGSLLENWAICE